MLLKGNNDYELSILGADIWGYRVVNARLGHEEEELGEASHYDNPSHYIEENSPFLPEQVILRVPAPHILEEELSTIPHESLCVLTNLLCSSMRLSHNYMKAVL
jgi:hypothetical protein